MPKQTLSLSFRPQSLDEMVGASHTVKMIRRHVESGRMPAAWMFIGESGAGKTTIARILALSLQCKHQSEFGNPCDECQARRSEFDIVEINASEASKVEETEQVIVGAFYNPKPPSRYRVYLFDEAQKLSDASQNCLLKYFEDSPKSTVWMICTTEPGKIKRTLRRRCTTYTMPTLGMKGIEILVRRAIKFSGEKKPSGPLTEALLESGVTSPGFVVAAVEKYLAGEEPERAVLVASDSAVDTLRICRAVVKGDWESVRHAVFAAGPEDARVIRASVGGYLKSILLDSDVGKQARTVANGIEDLATLSTLEEGLQLSATVALLYKLCRHFNGESR